ncbi:MAG: amidohydrolase family protein [bacterium]|nr:amidohydrolase family protein [bacterium]
MILDANAWIGHWPFRQLRHNTARSLIALMDQYEIDRAVVGSVHGIFYRNAHAANEEVAQECRRFRDRLIPFATLNPTYPGWQEDLTRCAEDLELCGIRLYPAYHGYRLTDGAALELIDAVTELNWAVQIPMRLEDRRQRHLWDQAADVSPAEIEAAVSLRPQTRWMVLNGIGIRGKNIPQGAHFVMEISRMTAVLQRNIQAFLDSAGPRSLAFGTGMPFTEPAPSFLKLDILDAPHSVKERIAWKNTSELLGLKPSNSTAPAS